MMVFSTRMAWLAATLLATLLHAAPLAANQTDDRGRVAKKPADEAAALRMPATITGRIVDEHGEPIEHALVELRTSAMGNLVWHAFRPTCRTDEDGRYKLEGPFRDIHYAIFANHIGFIRESKTLIATGRDMVDMQMRRPKTLKSITGRLIDPEGNPMANHPIELLGEYDNHMRTKTDERGRFAFEKINDYIGQAVLLTERDGLKAPILIARSGNQNLEVVLRETGTVTGLVKGADDGRPIDRVTVSLRPTFASDYSIATESAMDGSFTITDVPAGEYRVAATSADGGHWMDRDGASPKELTLSPGGEARVSIRMKRAARVTGRVIDPDGQPVPGAIVAMRSENRGDSRREAVYVHSDERGRFATNTMHLNTKLPVTAFAPALGIGQVQVETPGEGDAVGDITVKLPGALRLSGRVVDSKGKPIPDVFYVRDHLQTIYGRTGADGRFDCGRVSIRWDRPDSGISFEFTSPRPHRKGASWLTYSFDRSRSFVPVEDRTTAPTFYSHATLTLKPTPAERVEKIVTLEEIPLLKVTGVLRGDDGTPAGNTKVFLFSGDADAKRWTDIALPREIGGSRGHAMPEGRLFSATTTDSDGRWTIWTVHGKHHRFGQYFDRFDRTRMRIAFDTPEPFITEPIEIADDATNVEKDVNLAKDRKE